MSDILKPAAQETIGSVSMVPEATSTLASNKALVHRLVEELHNKRNLDVVPELLASDVSLQHSLLDTPATGLEAFRRNLEELHTGFPDLKATVQSIIAEGDLVAYVIRFEGTHQGAFQGREPCGTAIEWTAMHVATIRDGKIVDVKECDNVMSRMNKEMPAT